MQDLKEKKNNTGGASQPYLFILPDAFTPSEKQQKTENSSKEELPYVQTDSVYDRMSNVNAEQFNEKYLGRIDIQKLNPVLRKSLDRNSIVGAESISSASGSQLTNSFSQQDERTQAVRNILDTSSLSMQNSQLGDLIRELRKGQEQLQQDIVRRNQRLNGAQRNLHEYEHLFDDPMMKVNGFVSELVKLGYSGLHEIGNSIRNNSYLPRYEIFTAPPTSIYIQNNARIEEVKKEIELHQHALLKGNLELQRISHLLSSIEKQHAAFQKETDPQAYVQHINQIKKSTKEVIEVFSRIDQGDDPALKKEWDALRNKVQEGFHRLDRQFALAEATLHAAEKGVVVVGAIGGAAMTGGTSLGLLVGTGVGTVGSLSEMGGHFLSHSMMDTPESFNAEQELTKVGSDIKDAALYASGQRLSMALVGKTAKIATSAGKIKGADPLSTGVKALNNLNQSSNRLNYASPATYTKAAFGVIEAGGKLAQLGGTSMRHTFGGLASGILVEAPAALFDTTYSAFTDRNLLDPSGELRAMGMSTHYMWTRALTLRLSTAGTGGLFGFGVAKIKGNLALKGPIARDGFSMVGRGAATALEIPLDAAVNVNTEAYMRGWLYGANGRLREEDIEQLIVSSVAGHAAGKFQNYGVNAISLKRQATVEQTAADINNKTHHDVTEAGLHQNTNVAVVLGTKYDVDLSVVNEKGKPKVLDSNSVQANPHASDKNDSFVGMHLGKDDGLAHKRASQKEHRTYGNAVSSALSQVDPHLAKVIDGTIKTIDLELAQGKNFPGVQPFLQRDREIAQHVLKESVKDRAYGLAMLADSSNAKQTADYAKRISDHVERYLTEREGSKEANAQTSWVKNAYDRMANPYGAKSTKINIEKTPEALSDKGLTAYLTFPFRVANDYIGKPLYSLVDAVDANIFPVKKGLLSLWDASGMIGLGLYTATTSSIYGSLGTMGGSIYGGILLGGKFLSSVTQTGYVGYKFFRLDNLLLSRGSADATGNLIGKIAEGRVLLDELQALHKRDSTLVRQEQIEKLKNEISVNEKLLQKANVRYGGGLSFGVRALSATSELLVRRLDQKKRESFNSLDDAIAFRKSENRNRNISDETLKKTLLCAEELYREVLRHDVRDTVLRAKAIFRDRIAKPLDESDVVELVDFYVSDRSALSPQNRLLAARELIAALTDKKEALNKQIRDSGNAASDKQHDQLASLEYMIRYVSEGSYIQRLHSLDKKTFLSGAQKIKKEIISDIDTYIGNPELLRKLVFATIYPDSPLSKADKKEIIKKINSAVDARIKDLEGKKLDASELKKKKEQLQGLIHDIKELKQNSKLELSRNESFHTLISERIKNQIRNKMSEHIVSYLEKVCKDEKSSPKILFEKLNMLTSRHIRYLSHADVAKMQNYLIDIVIYANQNKNLIKKDAAESKTVRERINTILNGSDTVAKERLISMLEEILGSNRDHSDYISDNKHNVSSALKKDLDKLSDDPEINNLIRDCRKKSSTEIDISRDQVKAYIKSKAIIDLLSGRKVEKDTNEKMDISELRNKAGDELVQIILNRIEDGLNNTNSAGPVKNADIEAVFKSLYNNEANLHLNKFRKRFNSFEQSKADFIQQLHATLESVDPSTVSVRKELEGALLNLLKKPVFEAIVISKNKKNNQRVSGQYECTVHQSLAFNTQRDIPLIATLKVYRDIANIEKLTPLNLIYLLRSGLDDRATVLKNREDYLKNQSEEMRSMLVAYPQLLKIQKDAPIDINNIRDYITYVKQLQGSVEARKEALEILDTIINTHKSSNKKIKDAVDTDLGILRTFIVTQL